MGTMLTRFAFALAALIAAQLSFGCHYRRPVPIDRRTYLPPQFANRSASRSEERPAGELRPVSAVESAEAPRLPDRPEQNPLAGTKELSEQALIEQVLARHPSLAELTAAWQAALARYPQQRSLDDPMFGTTLAPGSIGDPNVKFGWRVEVSQKLPWPGKRDLRGQVALAEAGAAAEDVEDMRVQLVEMARHSLADYFLAHRALDVNAEALERLKESRDIAVASARTGRVPDQDFLQADVELAKQRERQLLLERTRDVAAARINKLLALPTNTPLPAPPKELAVPGTTPELEHLQSAAVANRPDLRVIADRIAAEQAALALAWKEYRPDFELMAAYDAFWQAPQQTLAPQVGLKMNLPVRKNRRRGAVDEAAARVAQRQAEYEKQKNQVNFEVQEAFSQLRESEKVIQLYIGTILPAAESNAKAAQTAYSNFKVPFLTWIEALRNWYGLRDRYNEAIAEQFRRRATLERAVGGPITPPASSPTASPNTPRVVPAH